MNFLVKAINKNYFSSRDETGAIVDIELVEKRLLRLKEFYWSRVLRRHLTMETRNQEALDNQPAFMRKLRAESIVIRKVLQRRDEELDLERQRAEEEGSSGLNPGFSKDLVQKVQAIFEQPLKILRQQRQQQQQQEGGGAVIEKSNRRLPLGSSVEPDLKLHDPSLTLRSKAPDHLHAIRVLLMILEFTDKLETMQGLCTAFKNRIRRGAGLSVTEEAAPSSDRSLVKKAPLPHFNNTRDLLRLLGSNFVDLCKLSLRICWMIIGQRFATLPSVPLKARL